MKTISSRPRARWHLRAAVLGLLACPLQASQPGELLGQSPAVTAALEVEDWAGVAEQLAPSAETCDAEPVHRMLLGHARLLTNDANDAVDMFYGCRTSDETNARTEADWLGWTEDFANGHPRLAVANYLYGDARARRGDLTAAARALDRAIELDAEHAGARNARGVVRWLLFESGIGPAEYELEAVADLEVAAERGLADAWANRGVIALRDGSATDFARRMFDEALIADSQYWMAVNGRAVTAAAAGAAAEYARILNDLESRGGSTPFTPLNDGSVRLEDTDLGGARGANDFSVGAGFEFSAPFGNTIKGNLDFQWRGGVFLTVAEGVNLHVHEDGEAPGVVGTWFSLNYPGSERDASR